MDKITDMYANLTLSLLHGQLLFLIHSKFKFLTQFPNSIKK